VSFISRSDEHSLINKKVGCDKWELDQTLIYISIYLFLKDEILITMSLDKKMFHGQAKNSINKICMHCQCHLIIETGFFFFVFFFCELRLVFEATLLFGIVMVIGLSKLILS
jgi:hypothetical protein